MSATRQRMAVALLSLSVAGFIGIVADEGYTGQAAIPTRKDRPTVGFGSTLHEDGRAVKLGDTTTPVRALVKVQAQVAREEQVFQASLAGAQLYAGEYDLYMNWVYQYGTGAWAKSSMRSEVLAGHYGAACQALLRYKFSGGYDCSTPGNKVCAGVWTRQQKRHAQCMAMQ